MPLPTHEAPLTLQQAIDVYLAEIERDASVHMNAAYQQALKLFLDVLRDQHKKKPDQTPITEIGVGWAEDYLAYLQAERAVETEHLYSRAMLDFYATVEAQGWADVSTEELATYLRENRRPKQHRVPDPPTNAINTIIEYAATTPIQATEDGSERDYLRMLRDRAFILMLAETGLKVSEICDLHREHLDLAEGALQLDSVRLALSTRTRSAIQSYLTARRKLDSQQKHQTNPDKLPLFARHDKRASDNILPISRWTASNIIDEWVRTALPSEMRSELESKQQTISPQTFRHYFVIATLEQTGDLTTTQTLARHTDPSTTRRYMQRIENEETNGHTAG